MKKILNSRDPFLVFSLILLLLPGKETSANLCLAPAHHTRPFSSKLITDEEELSALSASVAQCLHLLDGNGLKEKTGDAISEQYVLGEMTYPIQRWWSPDEVRKGDTLYHPVFVRFGFLFFIDREWHEKLPPPLRLQLNPNLIVLDEMNKSEFSDPEMLIHTLDSIALLMNLTGKEDAVFIDAGAGHGIQSLVAEKIGIKKLLLVENAVHYAPPQNGRYVQRDGFPIPQWLPATPYQTTSIASLAENNLKLNHLKQDDFLVLDLNLAYSLDEIVSALQQLKKKSKTPVRQIVFSMNVGPWSEYFITNLTGLNLIDELESRVDIPVTTVILSGYPKYPSYPDEWWENPDLSRRSEKMLVARNGLILGWAAGRNVCFSGAIGMRNHTNKILDPREVDQLVLSMLGFKISPVEARGELSLISTIPTSMRIPPLSRQGIAMMATRQSSKCTVSAQNPGFVHLEDIESFIRESRVRNIDSFEINLLNYPPGSIPTLLRDEWKMSAIRNDISLTLLASREYALIPNIELARHIGAKVVTFQAPALEDLRKNKALIKKLCSAIKKAKKYGIKIGFENGASHSPEDLNEIFSILRSNSDRDISDTAGITLNVRHIAESGRDPAGFLDLLDERVVNVHLSNYSPGSQDLRITDPGTVDFVSFIRALAQKGYRGNLVLEYWYDDLEKNAFWLKSRVLLPLYADLNQVRLNTEDRTSSREQFLAAA